ncbi:hypothetical protein [Mesorhizobium sp. M7A.F.Ca.US.008.03.1.1]|nr:hypothetical protein [Mesorhizobium sp. M7A.F.Ca.US.008.03.1.1]
MSSKSGPPAISNTASDTAMGDFLVDAEALLAARLKRVSPDDIRR